MLDPRVAVVHRQLLVEMGAFLLEILPGESDLQIVFFDVFLHIINGLRWKSRVISFLLEMELVEGSVTGSLGFL